MSTTVSTSLPLAERHAPDHDDWLSAEELGALTPELLVARIHDLKPMIAGCAEEAERIRRPVTAVWEALRQTGVFYHFVPRRYGGLEFGLAPFIEYVMDASEACASTGWVLGQCVEHNWGLTAYPRVAQDEIFAEFPYIIAPGVHSPPGTAVAVDGGYRVTGHWQWGSGIMNADWVKANVMLADPGGGRPAMRQVVFPASEADVPDVWHMDGMAGTGSNDIVVADLFVPAHRMLDVADWMAGRAEGSLTHENPVYRVPMLTFLSLTTMLPAIGAARAAARALAAGESRRLVPATTTTRDQTVSSQMRVARAELLVRSAELLVRDTAAEMMELATSGRSGEFLPRARIRAQNNYAMELCEDAVSTVVKGAGSSAHRLDNPIQRAWRDVHVMASHMLYNWDESSELYGQALLGQQPSSPRW